MKETKNMKWTSYNEQRARLTEEADIQRTKKHVFLCDIIISACLGASIVMAAILIHGKLF
ncbi:MAG: hypothetical protein H8E05_00260 [Bacteroidetes bacterium]|nr:hypothetical protein [Bacteroidota bacterium]